MIEFELFELLYSWTHRLEHWELDEFFLVAIIVSLAVIIISARRGAELRAEIALRQELEHESNLLARRDPLTGLGNRREIVDRLAAAADAPPDPATELAVLLIDLDRFKPVNDIYGHDAGDEVLCTVAARLQRIAVGAGPAIVARMGGDEFACVLEFARGTVAPEALAERMIASVRRPISTKAAKVVVGASIGIALDPLPRALTSELLRMADLAMYRAKADGRNHYRLYDPQMDADAESAARLGEELRIAIVRHEIIPHYQPISRLSDGRWVGLECLARWRHRERGLVGADKFIGVAEETGQIDELAMDLFQRACADAAHWPSDLSLSFNLSPVQLRDSWLPQQILRTLTEHGLPPARLILELTESGLISDFEVARSLILSLKNAGVRFALDDFGTGYSSLSHLRELPFDIIKIDRSFVEDIDLHDKDSLVTAIIRMGHSLGMELVAEGVTSKTNEVALRALGCDLAQGYRIGHALGADETLSAIAVNRSSGADGEERGDRAFGTPSNFVRARAGSSGERRAWPA